MTDQDAPFGVVHKKWDADSFGKSAADIGEYIGRGTRKTGGALHRVSYNTAQKGQIRRAKTGGRAGNIQNFFGRTGSGIGHAIHGTGAAMERHPERTTVLGTIGGGTAGYIGYKHHEENKRIRKSAFGVNHDEFSKLDDRQKKEVAVGAGVGAAGAGTYGVLAHTHLPEHQHYSKKTRKYLSSLPAGEHEVPTKMLAKKPRKLGARKQQRAYVAAMAQERPLHTYGAVPVTRYKGKKGAEFIQRDNAHTVMANAMKGRNTRIKIEEAPGHRPSRRTGEELVRRAQMRYQQHRLKNHFNLSEKKINNLVASYKPKSRAANTAKRPHGVVEDAFRVNTKKIGAKRLLTGGKNVTMLAKADDSKRNVLAGATGAAGVGTLASTPVRRSAPKARITDGQMSAKDAKRVVSPGYRPGNKRAIQVMARNLGHLEDKPTTVIRYKDKSVIPFDGNHRATARIARGDKQIPVKVVEGGNRPAVSVARNAYHVAGQRLHQSRMNRGVFTPNVKASAPNYTGKHAGESKVYSHIANGSALRSGRRVAIGSTKLAEGPSKMMLRGRQAATVGAGVGLLGAAEHFGRKKTANG